MKNLLKVLFAFALCAFFSTSAMAQKESHTRKTTKKCVKKEMEKRTTFEKIEDYVVPGAERFRKNEANKKCTREQLKIGKKRSGKGKSRPK